MTHMGTRAPRPICVALKILCYVGPRCPHFRSSRALWYFSLRCISSEQCSQEEVYQVTLVGDEKATEAAERRAGLCLSE